MGGQRELVWYFLPSDLLGMQIRKSVVIIQYTERAVIEEIKEPTQRGRLGDGSRRPSGYNITHLSPKG